MRWAWRLCAVVLVATGCRGPRGAPERSGDPVLTHELGARTVHILGVPDRLAAEAEEATRELLERYESSNGVEAYLDDAAFELALVLRAAGYPRAEVEYTVTGDSAQIAAELGPHVTIGEVVLEGLDGTSVSAAEVRGYLGEPPARLLGGRGTWAYDDARVQRTRERVTEALIYEGYLDAEAQLDVPSLATLGPEDTAVPVRVSVARGRRYRLGTVALDVVPSGSPEGSGDIGALCRRVLERVEGPASERPRPYTPRLAKELYGGLAEALGAAGHPDAVVRVDTEVDPSNARVQLRASVEPGPEVAVAAVRFEGAARTRASFLASRVEVEPGAVHDAAAVRADVRRLYRTGLFSEVRTRLDGAGGRRDLVFELLERPSREVWIEPGYGSYELLRVAAGVRERNLFGTGRALRAEGVAALRALRLSTTLTDPWLLGNDLIGDLRAEFDRRDEPSFVRLQRGLGAFVTKEWTSRVVTSVGYQFRRSEVRDVTVEDAELEDDPETVDLSTVRMTQRLDGRDDVFVPTRGGFAEGTLEYGGSAIGSELDFLRTTLSLSAYRALGDRDVLAASVRAGLITPLGGESGIPLQERFFNGGENSVRSYMESELGPRDRSGEPIGGEAFTTLGLEWRHAFTARLQGALFGDAGTLALDHADLIRFEDVGGAVGLGVRYLLPIGPLRVDVAANPDPESGEDDWAAHFSVGMAF